ncbi:hypothetical protein [Tautonia plasticadhaerens]|uniref:Uncharacterized protein n=1 Tax=Tautonia plasticadhaerens TaxID=2527974 RepID=A0A518HB60_9BACT|nr:hypothetical protein [Tautonia plasticadhaerens]QDV38047.1 hypothetical protein ElP_59950 [Tautonia plasticadhaerens]
MPRPTPPSVGEDQAAGPPEGKPVPIAFNLSVFATFFWIVFGLSIIYGYRVWWDAPIDPSFVPFMCVGFGVVVAFAIVLTLSYATGEIVFEAPGFKFQGASGPIVLWVVCFLAILFGFYLMGISEVVSSDSHERLPITEVHRRDTPPRPAD